MKYSELNLDSRLYANIEKLNYSEATPIQAQAVPPILAGKDVAGLAQTGTGKTAAFLIPLIERILRSSNHITSATVETAAVESAPGADATATVTEPGLREEKPEVDYMVVENRGLKNWGARSFVLILVPTRELADQILENTQKLTIGTGLKSFCLYGGTGYDKQKEALQSGLQFVISTPGRLIDLYKENFIDLKQVAAIVFDEADRMFDMGFKDDMKFILGRVPRERQFLVFSATLNFDVLNTAYQFGAEPFEINISRDQAKAENVKDFIIHLGHHEKPKFLLSMLKKENPKQVMIFTNFKHNVDRIVAFLLANKIPAMGISSLMSQSQRNKVIENFKGQNDQNILVATDVAARGLDINDVDLVFNYEMPQDPESYVHRIGRTGRAGREGKAFSLICDKDIDSLARVEEFTKKKIEAVYVEDSELIQDMAPFLDEEARFHQRTDRPRFDRPQRGGGGRGRDQQRGGGGGRGGPRERPDRNSDRQDRPVEARGPRNDNRNEHRHDNRNENGPRADGDQKNREPRHANQNGNGKFRGDGRRFENRNRPQGANNTQATKPQAHPNGPVSVKKSQPTSQSRGRVSPRTGQSPRVQPAAAAGLGQKVKSFIKRLFG